MENASLVLLFCIVESEMYIAHRAKYTEALHYFLLQPMNLGSVPATMRWPACICRNSYRLHTAYQYDMARKYLDSHGPM